MKDYLYQCEVVSEPFKEFRRAPFKRQKMVVIVAPTAEEAEARCQAIKAEVVSSMQAIYQAALVQEFAAIQHLLPAVAEFKVSWELVGVSEHSEALGE